MKDTDRRFHEEWLGLAKPSEGLVFSVPALADAQIAPVVEASLAAAFEAELDWHGKADEHSRRSNRSARQVAGEPSDEANASDEARSWIANTEQLFRRFLGYGDNIVLRQSLPDELSFYAPGGGQLVRPSFALPKHPISTSAAAEDDPFAIFERSAPSTTAAPSTSSSDVAKYNDQYFALVWDLRDDGATRGPARSNKRSQFGDTGSEPPAGVEYALDLDKPETATGPWRASPTAKLEHLLRQVDIAVGLLCNGAELRLIYAPKGESTAHLTFRVDHMRPRGGRPLLAAMELLLGARRAYSADTAHTLEGLLKESRRRQADVTTQLAEQVFEAVELLLAGFEQAAARDCRNGSLDWLRAANEAEDDHLYYGVLSIVLRLVFLLYSEHQALLPIEHPHYAQHLSVMGLYERLSEDAGAHPESMHHRSGAYGQLLALFRAIYRGVRHVDFRLPARRGKLFDPNTYPFLEGGMPDWTAAMDSPEARAEVRPPSIDDGTVHSVLRQLVLLDGQRLSYRELGVEQIGSVYESLMGYHVLRTVSPAVRIGKYGVWVEVDSVLRMNPTERKQFWKETCGLNPGPATSIESSVKAANGHGPKVFEALLSQSLGKKTNQARHQAEESRLVLQPGEERRRTGSHYTPPELTEQVVTRTLEPILRCLGSEPSAEQILQLKICDPAMGSGAFLVAACRQLALPVEAAWRRSGELPSIAEAHGDPHLHARRLVAQRCLYGVDKNAAAVELAKLSLWLVTLSKDKPFTFLDHALRHGDSLVGLDLDQIRAFHWKPSKQLEFCSKAVGEALEEALQHRAQILALANEEDPMAQGEKRRLLEFTQQATERIRIIADACVGAFFAKTSDKERESERGRRLELVKKLLDGDESVAPELEALAREARSRVAPFHWMLEFPEVFYQERPDPLQAGAVNGAAFMEAVVGNPPFAGKNNISNAGGPGYVEWLCALHDGAHGNSDLCAHFFRRAAKLLGRHGAFGLIATNTIAQGDTRTTGLARLVNDGWVLFNGVNSMPWPGAAAVTVSLVHGACGAPAERVRCVLDGREVAAINSRLRPKPDRPDPMQLRANAQCSFQGTVVLGMGFTLTPEERDALVAKNPKNAERIQPYLGGEEVNTSPTQAFERYVINFGQLSLEECEQWPDLLAIVREKVKPERDRNNREVRKKYWWRFGETTPALYATIAPLERCLVTARVTKHLMLCMLPTGRVLSEQLYAFPLDRYAAFGLLQSRIHEAWARLLSSSMKTDLRYAASDCFETFPFPKSDPRAAPPDLEAIGQQLHDTRAEFMRSTQHGLTKTYNALKDPSITKTNCDDTRILELRALHEDLDRAVLDAYGWSDIAVPPFCPVTDADRDAQQVFEDEVIDRLYVLNAERAREEARLGKASSRSAKMQRATKRNAKTQAQPKLAIDQGEGT